MNPYHVIIKPGSGVPSDAQGRAMLAMERMLRELTGLPIEVYKETKPDDSKLRSNMTPLERSKL